jgi:hypothetical protein
VAARASDAGVPVAAGDETKRRDARASVARGWPSWRALPWGGASSSTDSLAGSREGVLLSVWAMEASRALAVAAVVSTLAAGLFRGDARVAPTLTMDPSTPWLATCGGGRDAKASNDPSLHTVAHSGCASRPTQVVAVQLVLVLGSLLTFPVASRVADADTLGFPFALFVAAAFAPVVAFGYASAGVTRVSFGLIATRLLAGAYKSFNELGQETGVSVAFTPDAKGTPAAFGSRVAAGCVFGIIAPSIVSRAARNVGASRVFDGIAIVGVCVFCVVTVLVVMPAYRHRRDPSADSEKRAENENAFFLPVNGAPNDLHREKPSSPETKETKETEPRSSSTEPSSVPSPSPPPSLFASWRELVADGETRLLLFTAMCVGTAEFALEGPVMMALGGVLGFDTSANASFLSAYNVPRGVVSVLAEPILRRVQAQTLAAGGLLSAACGVAWLAALGEKAHESSGTEQTFSEQKTLWLSYVSAVALGFGVVCVHVSLPVLLAQAAAKPRHGARYGAAFGLSAVMAKAGGGAVGMGLAAVSVERLGFTAAFGGVAAVLLAGAGAVAVGGGNLRVALEK